jgi:hypothetical protein
MKKLLFTFTLLVSFASFANNSVIEINEKLIETKINKVELDQECYATCSVTIRNTETGETQTVSGFGHSHLSCDLAGASCLANARANAKKKIAELNNM